MSFMLRRAAWVGLLGTLASCSKDTVLLNDVWDAAISVQDSGSGGGREDRPPWPGPGSCKSENRSPRFDPQSPDLMLVLDRSSNMQATFPGAATRQAAVQSALSDAISAYQSRINFGLEVFPGDTNDRNKDCRSSCCAGAPIAPQTNALDAIGSSLLCSDQQGCQTGSSDSPSQKALEQVQACLADRARSSSWTDPPHSAYVLLITGAEPSCSADLSGADTCGTARTIATNLGKMDIPVIVLSVGYPADSNPSSCLVQLSNRGTVSPMPSNVPRLYISDSSNDLKDDLSTLLSALARKSCTLTAVDWVPDYATLTVSVGDTTIAKDASNGWSFGWDRSQIRLSGSACDQYLKSPQGTLVHVTYTCSTCADAANSCNY